MKLNVIPRAAVITACLILSTVALAQASRSESTPLRVPLSRFPTELGVWKGAPAAPLDQKVLTQLAVDDHLNRVYRSEGAMPVGLYVGYYESQRQGETMHSPMNCLPGSGWQPVESGRTRVALNSVVSGQTLAPLEINRYIVRKGGDNLLVLYWYQSHGRVVASEYWGKFYTVLDSIRLNRTDAALVRVVIPIPSGDLVSGNRENEARSEVVGADFVRTMYPLLVHHLPI